MMNYARNMNKIDSLIPFVFIGIILLVLNNLGLLKPKPKDKKLDDEENLINDIDKRNVHYQKSQFDSWANEIQTAMGNSFDQTDEATVYRIMRKMKSNDDYNMLNLAYGQRSYKEFWSLSFTEEFKTLPEVLTYELDEWEIKHVNNIFKQNGLTIRL